MAVELLELIVLPTLIGRPDAFGSSKIGREARRR